MQDMTISKNDRRIIHSLLVRKNAATCVMQFAAFVMLFQCQPTILGPMNSLLNQDTGSILRHTITMAEEDIAI